MVTTTLSNFRANQSEVLDAAQRAPVEILSRGSRRRAVVVSPEFFDRALQALEDQADVRGAAEVDTVRIPGALNIAHTELRDRIDEVRDAADGRPVRILCASAVRSYLAYRLLTQHGFDDTATLSGGMLTLEAWLGHRADTVLEHGRN